MEASACIFIRTIQLKFAINAKERRSAGNLQDVGRMNIYYILTTKEVTIELQNNLAQGPTTHTHARLREVLGRWQRLGFTVPMW